MVSTPRRLPGRRGHQRTLSGQQVSTRKWLAQVGPHEDLSESGIDGLELWGSTTLVSNCLITLHAVCECMAMVTYIIYVYIDLRLEAVALATSVAMLRSCITCRHRLPTVNHCPNHFSRGMMLATRSPGPGSGKGSRKGSRQAGLKCVFPETTLYKRADVLTLHIPGASWTWVCWTTRTQLIGQTGHPDWEC